MAQIESTHPRPALRQSSAALVFRKKCQNIRIIEYHIWQTSRRHSQVQPKAGQIIGIVRSNDDMLSSDLSELIG